MKKYFVKKSDKFGEWEVIDVRKQYHINDIKMSKPYILCYDGKNNELKYVKFYDLIHGRSKGSKAPGNRGWSTRVKNKDLPKYVHPYEVSRSKKKYRVVKKVPGTNKVKTHGYFNCVESAKIYSQMMED